MILKQSTTYTRMFLLVQSSDHRTGITGATPAATLSKAGAAFAAAGGAITEVANGIYKIALTTTDTNTVGDLAIHVTATSADALNFVDQVQSQIFTDLSINGSGQAYIATNIKQNTALADFMFLMTDVGVPATGLTVTAQRSINGAGFAPCANAVSEVGNGVYTIDLATADLNGTSIMFRFTAGVDDRDIYIVPQP